MEDYILFYVNLYLDKTEEAESMFRNVATWAAQIEARNELIEVIAKNPEYKNMVIERLKLAGQSIEFLN